MFAKKLLVVSAITLSLVVVAGCKTKTADVSKDATSPTAATATQETQNTAKAPATKEQCMDLITFAMKVASLKAQWDEAGALRFAQQASDLENKYINQNVEYEEACAAYMTDMAFAQEVQKRMTEIK